MGRSGALDVDVDNPGDRLRFRLTVSGRLLTWRKIALGWVRGFPRGRDMAMVRKWTGRESRALREAMRVSQRDFADQLGVSGKAIANWESGGVKFVPRHDSQAILDTKLRQVSDEVRNRFELILGTVTENDDAENAKGNENSVLTPMASAEVPVPSLAKTTITDAAEVGRHADREPVNQLVTERPYGEISRGNALRAPVPRARSEASLEKEFDSDYSASDGTRGAEFEPDTIEAMRRRVFLAELAASAGLGAAGFPLEAVRHGLNLSVAEERSAADADEWNQIALEYSESYLTAPASELLKPLMVDIIGLQSALQRSSSIRSHRDLMGVAALLSVFTAQTLMNMGQVHEARRWWRTAKNSADRSGDPYSVLWVRAREINRAAEFRPAAAVLLLVEEAENHVDHAPVDAVLEFLSAKALTLARAGRLNDAESVLDQIRKRSSGLAGESGSLLVFDRAGGLHGIESFVYSRLGNLEKTESANAAARNLQDSGNLRWLADDGMKLSFCLVRRGDITQGLRNAQTVLTQLPEQHRAQHLVSDAHELVQSIPASGRQLNAAHEYREWLSSL